MTPQDNREQERHDHELRDTPVAEYLQAHARPNGSWYKGFLRSNLFTALVIWILTQVGILVGTFIAINMKLSAMSEWKGGIDATLKRMDEQGTVKSHYIIEQLNAKVSTNEARITHVEADTAHLDVMESEFRRITADVEKLKNDAKK